MGLLSFVKEADQKVTLLLSKVPGVTDVESLMAVATPADQVRYHEVRRDRPSAIPRICHGNANRSPVIIHAERSRRDLSWPEAAHPAAGLTSSPRPAT